MESDAGTQKGKLMEDAFFRDKDKALLEKIRNEKKKQEQEETLATITGIQDENLLHQLTDNGVTVETITAMSLIPLIYVAWADHIMNVEEQEAILKGAESQGIIAGTSAYELLKSWFQEKPSATLYIAWKE